MSASKRLKLSSMAPSKQSSIVHFYDPDIQAKDALGRTQKQILAWSDNQLENSHNYIQMLFPLPEGSPFTYAAPVIDLETMKAFRANYELRQQLRRSFARMLTFYGFITSNHNEPESEDKKDAEKQEQDAAEETWPSTQAAPKPTEESDQDAQATAAVAGDTATKEKTAETTTAAAPSAEPKDPAPKPASQTSPLGHYVVRGPNFRQASRNWVGYMDHNHLRITRILRCLRVLGLQRECDAFFAALERVYDDPATKIGPRSLEFWSRAVQRPLYVAPDDEECDWLNAWEKEQQEER